MLAEFEKNVLNIIKTKISQYKTVSSYNGEFAKGTYNDILGVLPCALFVYSQSRFEQKNDLLLRNFEFDIIIAVEDFKNKKASNAAYELLDKTRDALNSTVFDNLVMQPVMIESEKLLYHDDRMAAFAQTYKTKIRSVL